MSKPFKPDSLYTKIIELTQSKSKKKEMVIEEENNDGFNEHVDIKTLDMFTNGKAELLQTTLEQLLISFKDDLATLKNALDEKKQDQLKAIAHKIKPNFLLIGMNRLSQLCKEIEHSEKQEELNNKVETLVKVLPSVMAEINDHAQKIHVHPV